MSVARSESKQVTVSEPPMLAEDATAGEVSALSAALDEIARIEHELTSVGDDATLKRFGNPEHGAALAAMLGHGRLSTAQARLVDQLSWMPDGLKLVRAYLGDVSPGDPSFELPVN